MIRLFSTFIVLVGVVLTTAPAHAKLKIIENASGGLSVTKVLPELLPPERQTNDREESNKVIERIVGGIPTQRGEFPEFTLILTVNNLGEVFICGGTVIDGNKILTAAHCLVGFRPNNVFVLPGFYSLNDFTSLDDLFRNSIRATRVATHPRFSFATFDSDIAVITLPFAINNSESFIYGGSDNLTGFNATPIGIGATSEGGNIASTVRKVTVPVTSNSACANAYRRFGIGINNRMICGGLNSGGRDSCQGDSGGPLLVKYKGRTLQAGITSFGVGCARPGIFGVYARTSALTSFIRQHAPGARIIDKVTTPTPSIMLLLDE